MTLTGLLYLGRVPKQADCGILKRAISRKNTGSIRIEKMLVCLMKEQHTGIGFESQIERRELFLNFSDPRTIKEAFIKLL